MKFPVFLKVPLACLAIVIVLDALTGAQTFKRFVSNGVQQPVTVLSEAVNAPVVGFSPDNGALDVVLMGINSARKSIDVAAYAFTSKPIAEALVNARHRGVAVRVVADAHESTSRYSVLMYLQGQGVSVQLDKQVDLMHNKFMVIDSSSVQTGSFNYTYSAVKNAENVILLRNVPKLAASYTQEYTRLYAESSPL